jgi:erythromycin esterase-like protein
MSTARYVLLGEASHGTSEYYRWRTTISQRLIEEQGFSFIAVEGDWPDCYRINRYVKGCVDSGESAREVLHNFARWPTWMWANEEIIPLVEWLRQHNDGLPAEQKVGFYGLDVYSLWESMYAVLGYLRKSLPAALPAARKAFRCFEPYGEEAEEYAYATRWVDHTCEGAVLHLLQELHRHAPPYPQDGRESFFQAEQNALVLKNAEAYYRAMVQGGPESWNIRDRHMTETLERLMQFHGPAARGIVWEHNTHIGDARFTDMAEEGMVNVGQLVREGKPEDAVLVGFGSYRGTVIASDSWGVPWQELPVPPAQAGSWEEILHQAGAQDRLLLFGAEEETSAFLEPRGHRAIGVVYHPERERFGNYVPTVLPRRYDAFLYLEETTALRPLHVQPREEGEVPETYPTGV